MKVAALVSCCALFLLMSCASGAPPRCGDGYLGEDEVCDDGNNSDGDGCSADCGSQEICGNGLVDDAAGEVCDDGNTVSGDGCNETCRSDETCGNGVVDDDEECDDGNVMAGDGCSPLCVTEVCGDGMVDPGEVCDDGNEIDGDGCSANCLSDETCGNDIVDGGETCDDGNNVSGDGCSEDCLSDESCGNNTVDTAAGETCDDGNSVDGDGCSSLCAVETVYLWTVRESDDMLRVLDTSNLTFTDIGTLTQTFEFGELAWDSSTQTMWMVDGRGSRSLHRVDINTGVVTTVGSHGITDLFGLVFDTSTNTLYGSGESPSGFFVMNTATGSASLIGDPGRAADGLAYDSLRDQILGLDAGGNGDMHIIDRVTGSSVVVSSNGFVNNCGLAYDARDDIYWAIDWDGSLYTYDPNSGYSRTGPILDNLGPHDGLTPGPPPP